MSDLWEETMLGGEVDLLVGFPFQSRDFTELPDGPRLLRGDNVAPGRLRWDGCRYWPESKQAGLDAYHLREGDVILAMDRPWIEAGLKCGWVKKADLPCLLVQRVARLRGGKRLDTTFLRYLISSQEFTEHILAVQTGTTVPHVSSKQITQFRFRRPPLRIQRAIARILGSLDNKIDLNGRMNETLEAMARALFRSWFVDFDPVHAKKAGRAPVGMDAETAPLFPDRFEDSPLGPIPTGWSVGPILEHADLLSGGTPDTNNRNYWDGPIPWASAKDVSQCGDPFLIHTERTITECGVAESATRIIPAWTTVVVARGATTGRLAMFGDAIAMNQTCYALRSRLGCDSGLYCLLRENIGALVSTAHGSVFDTITTATFRGSRVVLPDRLSLTAFESLTRAWFQMILTRQRESRTLAAIRDALLPRLLSGELRVPEAEAIAEVVT